MRRALHLIALILIAGCQAPVDWTSLPGGGGEGGGDRPPPSDPGDDDAVPDDPGDDDTPVRPVDDDPEPAPDDPADPTGGSVRPGGVCACDDDCRGDTAHPGLCIHGICGTQAAADECAPGSSDVCPAGQRCWSGSGIGVCYPDFVEGECEGVGDSYGSCVSPGDLDCYASCGTICDRPGSPDDIGPAPDDPEPEPTPDPEPEPDPEPTPDTGDLTPEEIDLLDALNAERAAYGLAPVEPDDRLMCAARNHALDVGETGECGHVGSDGSWPWDRAAACGFPQDTWTVNEIAAGPGFTSGADAVWGWQQSPGHHAAIVHPEARYVGVGIHDSCYIALFDCCVAEG